MYYQVMKNRKDNIILICSKFTPHSLLNFAPKLYLFIANVARVLDLF